MPITYLEMDPVHCEGWNAETGEPGEMLFANAVQVWSKAQGRQTSIQEAAEAFKTTPRLIRQAVEAHPWMLVDGDAIEHETP